ncbi:uncharacterized protein LOC127794404 [Diospyros lotus]|uniref:uncharacterized protein LOC127794404 n=1 Tax=Diospyros lotus TaxID=55363 RepID=UPI00225177AA|nr:uncharacterized protein LOC127794404 [Diospyros lotus]XP_052181409.1 uncharacterized protein LOC127794404 [Diospyros lotus]XP_052181410.1 uncharacterized protein LOC127794404 [Diospyros lotus]XP_052181411.1 uncharacterized protein LOC127794404 [Diospyros lotus]XP_052181412.1 uncharacterized protein LOC127794404 [Diospyros lotus]
MDFFKVKKFRKAHKPNPEKDAEDKPVPQPEEPKDDKGDNLGKSTNADPASEAEDDDDDDDFITNEVKRRLKELRRNSFMVLIPEEPGLEDEEEEEGETSSAEWRDVEAETQQSWFGLDAFYDKYCEQMLSFDRLSAQLLKEVGSSHIPTTPSPRSASKKLVAPFRCLSLKKMEEPDDDTEHLQEPENDPHQDLETAYVAQVCLTWEALHSQYTRLSQKVSSQPENSACYNHSAQQFQQFQVLLQRYIENEPFEKGLREEIYARSRNSLPKLLHVPNIRGLDQGETKEESDLVVLASDLIKVVESSIITFHLFLKMDKKKSNGVRYPFGGQNLATPVHQIQYSLEKKETKLKEVRKKMKGWKKKSWPASQEEVELLFGLIDVKILARVLRMERVTKEQLFWCEEKMKKVDVSDGKLLRDPSPILFPC